MVGHKKRQDRDKYYTLAKEQGFRARSAFKLIQLGRKFNLLEKCVRAIDLCAAPGGWMQVLAKHMPKSPERQIIGVDLMPIKPIPGCVSFVSDITTDKCRQQVRAEMKGQKADLVLCDGAPNVGSDYVKDAFVQNELTVHALKFAVEHLAKGGCFVTKVFRSADYNALLWSFNQLFSKVEATKPASSRNVSAEIFVVCRGFLAPHKVDPRLLDPKHVLDTVEQEQKLTEQSAVGVLFKKKDNLAKPKPNRSGYDAALGQTLHKSVSASDFVRSDEPIVLLATSNEVHFRGEDDATLLAHPSTTPEIKECLADLKVLGNAEFRNVLRWRTGIRGLFKADEEPAEGEGEGEEQGEQEQGDEARTSDESSSDGMSDVESELARLKHDRLKAKKKDEKKRRHEAAKHQRRVDMGMENEFAVDLADETGPFSGRRLGVKSIRQLGDIQEQEGGTYARERDNIAGSDSDEGFSSDGGGGEDEEEDDDDGGDTAAQRRRYLRELEAQAAHFHATRKGDEDSAAEPLSVRERRQQLQADKKAKMKKRTLEMKSAEDFARALEQEQELRTRKAGLLDGFRQSGQDEDENEEEEEEDQHESEEEEEEEEQAKATPALGAAERTAQDKRTKRWFGQGLFEGAEEEEEEQDDERVEAARRKAKAAVRGMGGKRRREAESDESDSAEEEDDDDDGDADDEVDPTVRQLPSQRTDKAKRAQKRAKLVARKERKADKRRQFQEREARSLNPDGALDDKGLEVVPRGAEEREDAEDTAEEDDAQSRRRRALEQDEELEEGVSKARPKWARELIRKGMGAGADEAGGEKEGFEVVPQEAARTARRVGGSGESDEDEDEPESDDDEAEEETYNSEDYDSDERAHHLALGAMLLKKSKRRKLLDAGYNRYAFNDPDDLPDWFVADENKHFRPSLPITKEMIDAVRARYKDLAAKPINKVAEARARKHRRLQIKVDKIKKQAAAVVDQPDINAKSKMRQLAKLYKGANVSKPNSVYVVSTKAGVKNTTSKKKMKGQKVKVVDRRQKKDLARDKHSVLKRKKMFGPKRKQKK